MQLSENAINAITLIITGDNKLSPYLTGPKIVEFFNEIGLAEIYDENFKARKKYTKETLLKINNSKKIETAINEIIKTKRFYNTNFSPEVAVEYLNEFLKDDGYKIILKENDYKIVKYNNIEYDIRRITNSIFIKEIGKKVKNSSRDSLEIEENMNKKIFVIYGRNENIRKDLFTFLRSIGLEPIEWIQAIQKTKKGAPYIGEVVDENLNLANAVIVLFTPDEIAILKKEYTQNDNEKKPVEQPRPNVLFEAGMAMGLKPEKTIFIEIGNIRDISDIIGRHVVKFDGSPEKRRELITKLRNINCLVNDSGTDWLTVGNFEIYQKQDSIFEEEFQKKEEEKQKQFEKVIKELEEMKTNSKAKDKMINDAAVIINSLRKDKIKYKLLYLHNFLVLNTKKVLFWFYNNMNNKITRDIYLNAWTPYINNLKELDSILDALLSTNMLVYDFLYLKITEEGINFLKFEQLI